MDITDLGNSSAKYYLGAVEELGEEEPWKLRMGTSRAVACLGVADTIVDAEKIAEHSIRQIKGPVFHRKDIVTMELVQKRIRHMNEIRKKAK